MMAHEKSLSEKLPVLVVTPQPFFEERGTPIAVKYVLEALSELGYQVDLIAFPMGREVSIPGLRVHRVINLLNIRSIPIGFSLRKLFLDFFLYFKIRQLLRKRQYNHIHAVEEASFIVARAARHSKVPFIYDMASSLSEQLKTHPVLGYRPFLKMIELSEAWVIRRASYVICSGGLLEHVRSVHQETQVSEWWYPSIIIDGVQAEEVKKIREDAGVSSEECLFVYTGSFSSYQGIGILLEAIALVEKSNISARFILAGATSKELQNIDSKWRSGFLGNVLVLGRVSREEVGKLLVAADALISPRLFGHNIPLKIFDYMGAGKPIIASDIPAHHAVLDEHRAIFFENTPDDLAKVIIDLTHNKFKVNALSDCSLEYAQKHLTWPLFRQSIEQMVNKVQDTHE